MANVEPGDIVYVYATDGKLLHSSAADSASLRISLKSGATYIVKAGGKTRNAPRILPVTGLLLDLLVKRRQWLEEMSPERFHFAKDYMGLSTEEGFIRGVLRTGLSSPARLFIAQMQDWLELGKEARINVPGTVGERNWTWRLHPGQLTEDLQHRMAYLTSLFGR